MLGLEALSSSWAQFHVSDPIPLRSLCLFSAPKRSRDFPVQDIVSPREGKGGALLLNLGEQKNRVEISRLRFSLWATLKVIKKEHCPACMPSQVEYPVYQEVTGLIPCQGTFPRIAGSIPSRRLAKKLIDVSFSLPYFLSKIN